MQQTSDSCSVVCTCDHIYQMDKTEIQGPPMRPSNNLENKTFSDALKNSSSMCVSSGSQFFKTTTGIQSGPDTLDESRFVMTFLIIFGVTEILCSFKLVLEGK